MSQGYLLIALGRKYIDECVFLAKTLRMQDDFRPISLLIHKEDEGYALSKSKFDKLIHFNPQGDIWDDCQNNFEKYCLYPRLYFPDYLPYYETIIVDSDVLCQYYTGYIWDYLSNRTLPIAMTGRLYDPKWHWGTIQNVSNKFGRSVPHTHGGFFYLRSEPFLDEFFKYCRSIFWAYDDLGCKRWYQNGRVDEIIFAIAHANYDMRPIEFDDFPIMSFNYTPDMQIPSRLQTEGGQNIQMNNYIPFIHMFDKMEGENFQTLYKKIMHEI